MAFLGPINAIIISTRRVVDDGFPISLVTHDDDGDWQILCGTTNEPADGSVMCLGCMFQRDRSIGQLADLPRDGKHGATQLPLPGSGKFADPRPSPSAASSATVVQYLTGSGV